MQKVRLSGITSDSIVDGTGIRMTIFTQGCPHNCEGCQNPQTHDFNDGYEETIENIYKKFVKNPLLSGITLSGGEPFMQSEPLIELCDKIKALGKNIWIYSGFTFDELLSGCVPKSEKLLSKVDVLVDGKFLLDERKLTLWFRGSRNQRVIDVQKSLAEKRIVIVEFDEEE